MNVVPDGILVVGSGGTGGHLIPSLARMVSYHSVFKQSIPKVVVIDGDEYEERNQTRQIVSPCDYGKNKAESMMNYCKYQGLSNVDCIPSYIDEFKFTEILMNYDFPVVVSCVDNDATRKMMIDSLNNLFSDSGDFFFISPGNSDGEEHVKGQTIWYGRINEIKYGIDPSLLYENIQNPLDSIPRSGTCSANAPSMPQLISANFMAAASTLTVIQNLFDEFLDSKTNSFFFDLRTMKTTYS